MMWTGRPISQTELRYFIMQKYWADGDCQIDCIYCVGHNQCYDAFSSSKKSSEESTNE